MMCCGVVRRDVMLCAAHYEGIFASVANGDAVNTLQNVLKTKNYIRKIFSGMDSIV